MKKFLLTTVAIAVLGAALPAHAADFAYRSPYKTPAYAAPLYNWTGFYIGAHAGGAFSSSDNFSGLGTGNNGNGRFVGGLQAGGDWQFAPNWVVGGEAQYSWLSGNVGAVFPGGFAYTNNQRGLGSITGRVGYTWGPGLVYVKGGYAYSDNNETVTAFGVPVAFATDADHKNGYTIGLGVEYMFAANWSAKAEYMYYNFGDTRFTAPAALAPTGTFTTDDHVIKAGVNYRFNLGGPVGARY